MEAETPKDFLFEIEWDDTHEVDYVKITAIGIAEARRKFKKTMKAYTNGAGSNSGRKWWLWGTFRQVGTI